MCWGSAGVTNTTNGYRDWTDFRDCSSVNAPGRYESFVNSVTYAALLDIVIVQRVRSATLFGNEWFF